MKTSGEISLVALVIAVLLLGLYAACPAPLPPPPYYVIALISILLAVALVMSAKWYRRLRAQRLTLPDGDRVLEHGVIGGTATSPDSLDQT